MTWKHWAVLASFVAGFVHPAAWWVCLGMYEFGVRRGRDVAAFWAVGHLHGRNDHNDH